jgi:cell division initiation protein
MRLTPLDIHQKEFRRGLRGYSEEEVDAFLEEVANEFERIFQENIELKEQVERLQRKLSQFENFEQTLQDTMLAAQKSAEEVQGNAKRAAELIIRDAELKAKEVVQRAYGERQEVQTEITQLKRLVDDFREKVRATIQSYTELLDKLGEEAEKLPVEEEVSQVEEAVETGEVAEEVQAAGVADEVSVEEEEVQAEVGEGEEAGESSTEEAKEGDELASLEEELNTFGEENSSESTEKES